MLCGFYNSTVVVYFTAILINDHFKFAENTGKIIKAGLIGFDISIEEESRIKSHQESLS
jgi:hypothetical protein